MWIPSPLYKRIGLFWLLLAVLFMTSGAYLGFDYTFSFVYFTAGIICFLQSIRIFVMRQSNRKAPHYIQAEAEAEEQPQGAQPDQEAQPEQEAQPAQPPQYPSRDYLHQDVKDYSQD